jgi:hypothetical protein
MKWKGFGRKLQWPNRGRALGFAWKCEENHEKLQSRLLVFCSRLKLTPSIYESTSLQLCQPVWWRNLLIICYTINYIACNIYATSIWDGFLCAISPSSPHQRPCPPAPSIKEMSPNQPNPLTDTHNKEDRQGNWFRQSVFSNCSAWALQ